MKDILRAYSRNGNIFIFLSALIIYFVIYGVVVTSDYAFSDDYTFYNDAGHRNLIPLITGIVQGGRPIYALYSCLFLLVGDIQDLGWLRLLSIAGIAAFSTLMYSNLKKYQYLPCWLAFLTAIACGLSQSFQVYAAWTVTSPFPWAAAIAGLGAMLILVQGRATNMVLSMLLLTCSVMIYQPAAMVFWAFLLPELVFKKAGIHEIKIFIKASVVMGLALSLDFIASKVLPHLMFTNLPPFGRSGLTRDFIGKGGWFLSEVIPDALSMFTILPNMLYSSIVLTIIVSGILLVNRKIYPAFLAVSIVFFVLILSYLPNLLIKESWASYRSQAGIGVVIIVLFFSSVSIICNTFKLVRSSYFIIGMITIVAAIFAHKDVNDYFVKPQVKELILVEDYILQQKNLYDAESFYFVPARWSDKISPVLRYDEFGLPSTMQVWVPTGIAWAVLSRRPSGAPRGLLSPTVGTAEDAPHQNNILVIDLRRALHSGKID